MKWIPALNHILYFPLAVFIWLILPQTVALADWKKEVWMIMMIRHVVGVVYWKSIKMINKMNQSN